MDAATREAGPARREALFWLVLLGLFFFAGYGLSNQLAALRGDVPSLHFAWENRIPFLPAMILPYWSLDLLFAGSFFLCADRTALRTHAGRIAFVIGVSVVFFLVFPLRFAEAKPAADGLWGVLFNALALFDQPYNQAPSLHISLAVVIWAVYAKRVTGGLWRMALHLWFAAIVASVLLTWQHHFIDLPSGAAVGIAAFLLIPDRSPHRVAARRILIAGRYAVAAGVIAVLAAWSPPWSLILLWPALSLAIPAAAYAGLGPAVFGKRDGRIGAVRSVMLLPYRAIARAWQRWLIRRRPSWVTVAPGLLIGGLPDAATARALHREGVTTVIDLTAEFPECGALRGTGYHNIPMPDLVEPDPALVEQTLVILRRCAGREIVYLHCAMGLGRAAAVADAWLKETGRNGN